MDIRSSPSVSSASEGPAALTGAETIHKPSAFDQLIKEPLKEAVHAIQHQEQGMEKALKGELSEDELLLLIKEADLQLDKLVTVARHLVQATEKITQAAGG